MEEPAHSCRVPEPVVEIDRLLGQVNMGFETRAGEVLESLRGDPERSLHATAEHNHFGTVIDELLHIGRLHTGMWRVPVSVQSHSLPPPGHSLTSLNVPRPSTSVRPQLMEMIRGDPSVMPEVLQTPPGPPRHRPLRPAPVPSGASSSRIRLPALAGENRAAYGWPPGIEGVMNRQDQRAVSKRTGRRIGYSVAVGCNVASLVIVNNVLDWGWFSWLTEDLEQVLPFVNASLIASIVVNVLDLAYDPRWFRSIGELGMLIFSLIATIRILQVFPFDFSAYEFGWATLTRWILGAAIFGVSVAMLVHLVRLALMARDLGESTAGPDRDPSSGA